MRLWGIFNTNADVFLRNRDAQIMFFTLKEQAENMIMRMGLDPKIYVAKVYRR